MEDAASRKEDGGRKGPPPMRDNKQKGKRKEGAVHRFAGGERRFSASK